MGTQHTQALQRASGILLHISSLPSRYGIGDMGNEAYTFVEFLAAAGQKLWQVLPLSPTGYGNSPYSAYSAFACNPLFISLDHMVQRGLLTAADIADVPAFPHDTVDYDRVQQWKAQCYYRAFCTWNNAQGANAPEYLSFCSEQHYWLSDYALFMALKEHFDGKPWHEWERAIALRNADAVAHYAHTLAERVEYQKFLQFQCNTQWQWLKAYANIYGVSIVGDIPIFLAYDSADVWANRSLFRLTTNGKPTVVTGVPPDYFSKTGQRWGNPHYNWSAMNNNNFAWWKGRFTRVFALYDIVRIDHFRGFAASYEIRATAPDATRGQWRKVPGKQLFTALHNHFGTLPVLAEDLGFITDDVHALRRFCGFPGMRVLQFGYESGEVNNGFLPHNFERDSVVYTGTHDNDTTVGWYRTLPAHAAEFLHSYLGTTTETEICSALVQQALASVAVLAIIPVQDILALGPEARMNRPGEPKGNWAFRLRSDALTPQVAQQLRTWTHLYNR